MFYMPDLSTRYMGLDLANPIVVSSCSLTKDLDGVRRCAEAGAGAIVLKSLFEEQIEVEVKEIERHAWPAWHPEISDYIKGMGFELGPREYLRLIEESKRAVSVPIIASLNCITPRGWVDYAGQIESAGADGLELNVAIMPSDPSCDGRAVEEAYLRILEEVRGRVGIPIAVKIGPYFTSISWMADQLCRRGASALVLFNRFYQLDIDIEKLELAPGYRFSSPQEITLPLRWIALLSGRVGCDLAASTGVHDGAGVVKLLLAGATVVQACSTLYLNGVEHIGRMIEELEGWMKEHGFSSIDEFRGKLSQRLGENPELFERLQYIKALVGIE